ncbi:MAG: tetratricopeptide repeat protein, partial [Deltaproteobacteria bacterium]|nr:tetratricopeptide repeat protein [Deltaproteobacteria bacterium]
RHTLTIRTALLITGVFYILLQNLVDFNLEIFSIQTTLIIIIATLISRLRHLQSELDKPHFPPEKIILNTSHFIIISSILTILFITGILLTGSNRREKIEAETELMLNTGLNPDDIYFKKQIRKFPFNYYLSAAVAARNYLDTEKPIIKAYLLHSSLINPIAFEPHYMLYRYFMKKGEFANAQSECRLAIRYARWNKERLIYSELLRSVNRKELFKYIPYTPDKITSFADYLLGNSETELAREFIEDALYLSENNPDIIKSAFFIYIRLRDIENAEKILKKYEEKEKGYYIHLLRGIFYEAQNRDEEALRHFIAADTMKPLNSEILIRIANLYKKTERFEEARRYYLKVFLCDNINTDTKVSVYINLAESYLRQKNSYEALKYMRTALNLRNNDIGIRSSIASICEQNGNLNCALTEYRDILRINPAYKPAEDKVRLLEKRLKEIEENRRLEQLRK